MSQKCPTPLTLWWWNPLTFYRNELAKNQYFTVLTYTFAFLAHKGFLQNEPKSTLPPKTVARPTILKYTYM
jgi:hypothetical protein